MIPQTPTGSLNVNTVVFGVLEGIVSPYALGASSANQATNDAAYVTSPFASPNVLPFSRDRMRPTMHKDQIKLQTKTRGLSYYHLDFG
jgi:hypothetical protein